jgi:hypothetical protein
MYCIVYEQNIRQQNKKKWQAKYSQAIKEEWLNVYNPLQRNGALFLIHRK